MPPPVVKLEQFDLAVKAYKAHGFLWTKEELWALKDIKDDCERRHDVDTSLQDLIRCALHMLVEDYRSRGDDSFVVRRVVKKQR